MGEVTSYRDLEIWKRGIELSVAVYHLTSDFHEDERFGLTAQIRRAVTSFPANVAEG